MQIWRPVQEAEEARQAAIKASEFAPTVTRKLQEEVDAAHEALEAANSDLDEARKVIHEKQSAVEEAQLERNASASRVAQLEQDIASISSKLDNFAKENMELKGLQEQIVCERDEHSSQAERLGKELRKAEEALAASDAKVDDLERLQQEARD